MIEVKIKIFDVTKDGFPQHGEAVNFIYDGDIYTGWPLINAGLYEGGEPKDDFMDERDALDWPNDVIWETSELCGEFSSVRFWFNTEELENL